MEKMINIELTNEEFDLIFKIGYLEDKFSLLKGGVNND